MPFIKEVINWNNQGSNIPSQVSNEGWKTLQSPAPAYFNKFWHTTTEALKELQSDAIHNDQKGATNGVAPLVGGKIPSQYLEESGSTVQGNLDKHIKEDIGHVRFLGSTIGTNTMELISDGLIPFVDDNATNPVPKTGVAFRFVKTDNNNGSVTLRIRDTKLGKSTLNYGLFNSQNRVLQAGELVNGVIYTASFNGTSFFLQGSGSGVTSGSQGSIAYTTAGSHTLVVPQGITRMVAYLWGGGGGGGGANLYQKLGGGGGGAGGFKKVILDVNPNSTITIVVGSGGTGGNAINSSASNGQSGSAGGSTYVTGVLNGPSTETIAFGGGGGTGGGPTAGTIANGGGGAGHGFTGLNNLITNKNDYRNGEVQQVNVAQLYNVITSITGASGSFTNDGYGGGGGASAGDSGGGKHGGDAAGSSWYLGGANSGSYTYYAGGMGGFGFSSASGGNNGNPRGGGGAGGNPLYAATNNGGKGGDGFAVLAW